MERHCPHLAYRWAIETGGFVQVFEDQGLFHVLELNLEIPARTQHTDEDPTTTAQCIIIACESAHCAEMWTACLKANP